MTSPLPQPQETSLFSVKFEPEDFSLKDTWHRSGQDEAPKRKQGGKVKSCLLKHETLQHPFPIPAPRRTAMSLIVLFPPFPLLGRVLKDPSPENKNY